MFLTPGQKPFGKEAFAAASRASAGKVRIEGDQRRAGSLGRGRHGLLPDPPPRYGHPGTGGEPRRLSGHTLSVLRKQPDGRWLLARDANLLTPEPRRHGLQAAVPVFQVASVAQSIAWYRDVLGFTADPFGPPGEPVFAILRRDGVELMLQKNRSASLPVRPPATELRMDAYLRVADVRSLWEAVRPPARCAAHCYAGIRLPRVLRDRSRWPHSCLRTEGVS